jgi:putative transposase
MKQCRLLSINRSSAYRKPIEVKNDIRTIVVMNEIDAIHTDHHIFGYRKITDILRKEDLINKRRVQRLMREMDTLTIYPKPNHSKRYHAQYVKPYLLRNLKIVHQTKFSV